MQKSLHRKKLNLFSYRKLSPSSGSSYDALQLKVYVHVVKSQQSLFWAILKYTSLRFTGNKFRFTVFLFSSIGNTWALTFLSCKYTCIWCVFSWFWRNKTWRRLKLFLYRWKRKEMENLQINVGHNKGYKKYIYSCNNLK